MQLGDFYNINNYHFIFAGSYRECFSRSYKLGIRSQPIKVTPNCVLQRTQRDPTSSIRACLCTSDNCNILNSERRLLNNSTATKVVGKKCSQEFFASYVYLSSIKAQLFSAYHHLTPFDEETSFHWDTRTIMKMIDFILCGFL